MPLTVALVHSNGFHQVVDLLEKELARRRGLEAGSALSLQSLPDLSS